MTTTATKKTPATERFAFLQRSILKPSPTNPRKDLGDPKAFEQLVESVRASGILQPLLVRPMDHGKPVAEHVFAESELSDFDSFELVFGHRRLSAAGVANLAAVPCIVRSLSDEEVLEAQIIENCQRTDMHPMDEAEAYHRLRKDFKHSVEQIAEMIGKSIAYIYATLKLCDLAPKVRDAFKAGKLSRSVALLIARIPDADVQDTATKNLLARASRFKEDGVSYRAAFDYIQREVLLRLKDAPFDTNDELLLPAAGACSSCPKKTGNEKLLWDDVKDKDLCTDGVCFKQKIDAAWTRTSTKAKDEGRTVLADNAAKKLFPYEHDRVPRSNSGYVALDAQCYADPKARKYSTLLKDAIKSGEVEVAIVRDPRGAPREVVAAKDVEAALKESGEKWARSSSGSGGGDSYRAQQRADDRKRKAARAVKGEVVARIVAAFEKRHGDGKLPGVLDVPLRFIARGLVAEVWHESRKHVVSRRGLEPKKTKHKYGGSTIDYSAPLEEIVETGKPAEVFGLVLELILSREINFEGDGSGDRLIPKAASFFNVDRAKVARELAEKSGANKQARKPPKKDAPKKDAKKDAKQSSVRAKGSKAAPAKASSKAGKGRGPLNPKARQEAAKAGA